MHKTREAIDAQQAAFSELTEQEYYQLYRQKTIEYGYTTIGRQRFAGIIKTLSLIPCTIGYISRKTDKS